MRMVWVFAERFFICFLITAALTGCLLWELTAVLLINEKNNNDTWFMSVSKDLQRHIYTHTQRKSDVQVVSIKKYSILLLQMAQIYFLRTAYQFWIIIAVRMNVMLPLRNTPFMRHLVRCCTSNVTNVFTFSRIVSCYTRAHYNEAENIYRK